MSNDSVLVQRQEDRWQIQQVLCRYCEIVDRHEWETMDTVFTADTVGVYNGMEVIGIDALIASANTNMSRTTIARTQHNVANFRIEIDGDEACCTTNYYAVHLGAGDFHGQIYSMWGEYKDQLLRTSRGWRIARRDYTTSFTEGDDRMVFAGETPTWIEGESEAE